jgi:pimeloyl-ACP methyl ester carboxylesterase
LLAAWLTSGCLAFHRGAMPGEPAEATYADVDGARVRYTDEGKGEAVVLVHGFASSLETWALVAPRLVAHHRVLSLDLKGFGWTDRPQGDYSPDAEARMVWALLDQRGVEKTALVGHSWGASVVLAMALQHPERVTRIALYDAWTYQEQLPAFFLWAQADGLGEALVDMFYEQRPDEKLALAFYNQAFLTERLAEEVERATKRPGTKAAALAAIRGMNYFAMQQKYRTLHMPSLLLWGREDSTTTLEFGERLAHDLNARLVVYPRCAHFPMLEAAEASTDELERFLGGTP